MKPAKLSSTIASSIVFAFSSLVFTPSAACQRDDYLSWSAKQADSIAKSMRKSGRVGAGQGIIHTERATNYKLRVTWFTPDVIRAAARLEQLKSRLSDERTESLVAEAEAAGDTVFLIEIDPNEGSGVIPLDWQIFLQTKKARAADGNAVAGVKSPALREIKVLAGIGQRDYDYDVYWVVFPLKTEKGMALFSDSDQDAELVVRIYNKEGRITWPIPVSVRERIKRPGDAR